MVVKFNPYGALNINRGYRILIVLNLYCCSKHELSTIFLANIVILTRFVTLAFCFFACFILYIINDSITVNEYS